MDFMILLLLITTTIQITSQSNDADADPTIQSLSAEPQSEESSDDYDYEYEYEEEEPDPTTNPMNNLQKEDSCETYCYSSSNKCCGYTSSHWGSLCRSGKYQSPISLPPCVIKQSLPNKQLQLDGDLYKGKFSLENNGHTVIVRFIDKKSIELSGSYNLDRIEFKWGKDQDSGSEHCVKRIDNLKKNDCSRESMEIQFIHYKSQYESFDKAVLSNLKDSVLIISLLVRGQDSIDDSITPVLNPLVKQLDLISEYGSSVNVKSTLDFTPWLSIPNLASSYHGSMSTPVCRQVVKWVVLQNPVVVRNSDLSGFRVNGVDGGIVSKNRRPLQKRNKREVGCFLFGVLYGSSSDQGVRGG